ncbi:MAG: family 1 glycosylhydrolase [Lachnospiraceae bacterium]|nr:family 1 glycosylhydrolase [Lachnospiraceae bacterium]
MNGYRLPQTLLLGVSSSAAQIEGGETAGNWNEWCRMNRISDKSSISRACDHWNRWKEDIDIMAAMGVQTYRMGIEWSRIQPKPGSIDYTAVNHYRQELEYLQTRGIRPLLTIHHFSNPLWFEKKGGFEAPANVRYFLKYVGIIVNCFGDLVSDYVTFSEPNAYAFGGYAGQGFPPGENNPITLRRVLSVMAGCHIRAYEKIHRMRTAMGYSDTKVGIALQMKVFAPLQPSSVWMKHSAELQRRAYQEAVAKAFLTGDFRGPLENLGHFKKGLYCDYLGISYASRVHVSKPGEEQARPQDPKDDHGREIYHYGLELCMQELVNTVQGQLPVWILSSGADDRKDAFRSLFLYDQLNVLAKTKLPVERYYCRSFTDSFEWLDGEKSRFGLVRVNFETQERTVKKSGRFFREIVAAGGVTPDMAERYVKGEKYHK